MESDRSHGEDSSTSDKVKFYYKKFCQNKDLPKYFRGTSISYLPDIDPTKDSENDGESEKNRQLSPSSSITSTKKLEWDNGGDIGYQNMQSYSFLHKSSSVPLLSSRKSSNDVKKLSYPNINVNIEEVINKEFCFKLPTSSSSSSSTSSNGVLPAKQSSSTSVILGERKIIYSTDKTTTNSSNTVATSSTSSKSYFKAIGSPNAKSTPVDLPELKMNDSEESSSNTPFIKKLKKPQRNVFEKVSILTQDSYERIINLCRTKPIVIECIDKSKDTESEHKNIQTNILNRETKGIQTDKVKIIHKKEPAEFTDNQSVVFIHHFNPELNKNSDFISSSNSFEYVDGGNFNVKGQSEKKQKSSTDSNLKVLIDTQIHSNEIDKVIELVHNVVNNRDVNNVTKKKIIKQILIKLFEKSLSTTSSSSELFHPKKSSSKNIGFTTTQTSSTVESEKIGSTSNNLPTISPNNDNPKIQGNIQIKSKNKNSSNSNPSQSNKSSSIYRSSESSQSWRDNKTLSEKFLEQKKHNNGDHLVDFAKRERKNQLAWIQDEITHLSKLKLLLEKHVKEKSKSYSKTTTVYKIIKQSDVIRSSSGTGSECNFVIETELSSNTSGNNVQSEKECKYSSDVKYSSDNRTTNIKIKSKKLNTEPNLIDYGNVFIRESSTFPRSQTDKYKMLRSYQTPINSSRKSVSTQNNNVEVQNEEIQTLNKEFKHKEIQTILQKDKIKNGNDNEDEKTFIEVEEKIGMTNLLDKKSQIHVKDQGVQYEFNSVNYNNNNVKTNYCDKETVTECQCTSKKIQTNLDYKNNINNTLLHHETNNSSIETSKLCSCCKKYISNIYSISHKNSIYNLCDICLQQKHVKLSNYDKSNHICNCYKLIKSKTYNEIKKIVDELNDIEQEQCICVKKKNCYCNCLNKLKKSNKTKKPIAYMLTFENCTPPIQMRKKKHKQLQEIKIKIPHFSKKIDKEKKNFQVKNLLLTTTEEEDEEEGKEKETNEITTPLPSPIPQLTPTPTPTSTPTTPTSASASASASASSPTPSTLSTSTKSVTATTTTNNNNHSVSVVNLQEYLRKNRPNFVKNANKRKKIINNSKLVREQTQEKRKLSIISRDRYRLFSSKEMKEITQKKYKKLPEVQNKLKQFKERQIKLSNRIYANTFNRKLKESVLKGKCSYPTEVNVINL